MVTLTTIGDMVICILAIIGAVYAVRITLFSRASLIYRRIKKQRRDFSGHFFGYAEPETHLHSYASILTCEAACCRAP